MKVKPLADYVVVKLVKKIDEVTQAGILIPADSTVAPLVGELLDFSDQFSYDGINAADLQWASRWGFEPDALQAKEPYAKGKQYVISNTAKPIVLAKDLWMIRAKHLIGEVQS